MQILINPEQSAATVTCYLLTPSDLATASLGDLASQTIIAAAKQSRFHGRAGDVFETFVEGASADAAQRIVLLGVGGADRTALTLEKAGASLTAKYLTSGVAAIHIAADQSLASLNDADLTSLLTGAYLRSWRMDQYHTTKAAEALPSLETLSLLGGGSDLAANWEEALAIAEGVFLTRELVAEPANIIYPESFVARCQHLTDLGVEITVLGDDEMRELGMGALLGVSQGSAKPARLLVMRWKGAENKGGKPVVFVGKGVTFDTGGISIKPAAGMEAMKWDMGGAGAVAGAMKALAGRKAKADVIGICGLVENMPDGNAQRPGDVVTTMSGQTVEVINTDAEGRLVLCDALHWAQEEYSPEYIVNLATLTGAMIIALGHDHGGLFSNDDGLSEMLTSAGETAGDPLWRMPMGASYDKLIDSPIADIKNVGPRQAGSITAAQFLKRFIKPGVKWAHLDIAGMVWADKPGHAWDKGATGYGARLLDRFVAANFEQE